MRRSVGEVFVLGFPTLAGCLETSLVELRPLIPPDESAPDASAEVASDAAPPWAPWESLDACVVALDDFELRDHDGDGVLGVWLVGCGTERQAQQDASNDDDCDDEDPTRARKAWRDADGDGWTSGRTPACLQTLEPGYQRLRSARDDCDDSDPTRQQVAYPDRDGDRYGTDAEELCAGDARFGPWPPGISYDANDCDDYDRTINPGAEEAWQDGVDSNCDGQDDPLSCRGFRGQCGCELREIDSVPVVPGCTGADLVFVGRVVCSECFGYNTFVVGNQGTRPSSGGFELATGNGIGSVRVPLDLEPGAVSPPIIISNGLPTSIRILTSLGEECDLSNNEGELEEASGHCP